MFSNYLSFYHPLITGVLHGGSTWWFIKDSFHSSIVLQVLLSELRSAKLYSKIKMVPNTCFVLRSSSIIHLASEVQFFLPYLLRRCYVILDNFPSCFMIHKFSRLTYLNPSFSVRSRDLFNQSIFLLEYLGIDFT